MKTLTLALTLGLTSLSLFAGTVFKGQIRNVTPHDISNLTVQVSRSCEMFCDVHYWISPKTKVNANGTWTVKSPLGPGGDYSVIVAAPNVAYASMQIYYQDFHNKVVETTVIQTLPATIPVRLKDGKDAGPWIRNVVQDRKIELFEEIRMDLNSPPPMTKTLEGSTLFVPETLFIHRGLKDLDYKHILRSVMADVPDFPGTKSSLERTGILGPDFYTSITEIIVDNTLDNPVFEGHYTGTLIPLHSWEMSPDYFPDLKGQMTVKCDGQKLTGSFDGEYVDQNHGLSSGIGFSIAVNGECGLGLASFPVTVELPPKGTKPAYRQTFELTSNSINGKGIYLMGFDANQERFNGHFSK